MPNLIETATDDVRARKIFEDALRRQAEAEKKEQRKRLLITMGRSKVTRELIDHIVNEDCGGILSVALSHKEMVPAAFDTLAELTKSFTTQVRNEAVFSMIYIAGERREYIDRFINLMVPLLTSRYLTESGIAGYGLSELARTHEELIPKLWGIASERMFTGGLPGYGPTHMLLNIAVKHGEYAPRFIDLIKRRISKQALLEPVRDAEDEINALGTIAKTYKEHTDEVISILRPLLKRKESPTLMKWRAVGVMREIALTYREYMRDAVKIIVPSVSEPSMGDCVVFNIEYMARKRPYEMMSALKLSAENEADTQECISLYIGLLRNRIVTKVGAMTYSLLKALRDEAVSKAVGMRLKDVNGILLDGLEFIHGNEEFKDQLRMSVSGTWQDYVRKLNEDNGTLGELKKLGVESFGKKNIGGWSSEKKLVLSGENMQDITMSQLKSTAVTVVRECLKRKEAGGILPSKIPGRMYRTLKDIMGEERLRMLYKGATDSIDKGTLTAAMDAISEQLKTIAAINPKVSNILYHTNEVLLKLGQVVEMGNEKSYPVTFKISDKNPMKDSTNGNDSGCCVALNGDKNWTIPLYLKDDAVQIMEVWVGRETRTKRLGQSWIFAAKDERNRPILIIDSINVSGELKGHNALYEGLIKHIVDYAKKAGFKEVVMGTKYNDAIPYAEPRFKVKAMNIRKVHHMKEAVYTDVFDKSEEEQIAGKKPQTVMMGEANVFKIWDSGG